MRRWMAPALFAAAAALALTDNTPQRVAAQDKDAPVAETFRTADGVKLHGLFHKSAKGGQGDPVVVFLYPPGVDKSMTKPGDWDGLAKRLNKEGFHVFRFDWRGHGKSTDIVDPKLFWENQWTGSWNARHIQGPKKGPVKNDVFAKEIKAGYFPAYITDLAAVRMHLDQKNDQGDLNTSSIYVIGAGDTASLGLFWLTAEWVRPDVHPTLVNGQQYAVVPDLRVQVNNPAGADFAGLIWLSGTKSDTMPRGAIQNWVKTTLKMRENNPMLLLYGPDDRKAVEQAKFFFHNVLVADGDKPLNVKKLDQTFLKPLPAAKSLSGVALLGNNDTLQTEDTIVKYLAALQKERVTLVRKNRNYAGPYFVDLRYFGLAP